MMAQFCEEGRGGTRVSLVKARSCGQVHATTRSSAALLSCHHTLECCSPFLLLSFLLQV
jgi:hypothetical protein